jgi:hypothetical protein
MKPARSKPAVEFPDIWTDGEIEAIWGVDPRKSPLTYRFTFFDPDLNRLRSYLQQLMQEGFVFEDMEPSSSGFGRIYGSDSWMMKVNITGIFPRSKLKVFSERFCDDVANDKVWALFTTIGCSHPSKAARSEDWERRWNTSFAKGQKLLEGKKTAQGHVAISYLDAELKKLEAQQGSRLSEWFPFVSMDVRGAGLILTDMRPGPSEDELLIALPRGKYDLSLRMWVRPKRVAGLRALGCARVSKRTLRLGAVTTDMASLGIYDRRSMTRLLRKGREVFSEWGEAARGDGSRLYDILVYDLKSGAILPCVQTGFGDGTFPVYELAANGKRVGFEVEFINKSGEVPVLTD